MADRSNARYIQRLTGWSYQKALMIVRENRQVSIDIKSKTGYPRKVCCALAAGIQVPESDKTKDGE